MKRKIGRVINKGLRALRQAKVSSKESKRFIKIYNAVYKHATKKGQTADEALKYCWNVYSEQAPEQAKTIIKSTLRENMSVERKQIRKMLLEALESEVINMADYKPAAPVEPDPEIGPLPEFESFLSDIHSQMLDFMEENFETLTSDQQVFLDEMLDVLEDELGIEDESSFDFGEEEEIIADIDDDA